jgi:hypothetical protein
MTAPASEGAATTPTSIFALSPPPSPNQFPANRRQAYQASATAFVVLFCIVGVSLWGLPFYYDFMVERFHWTRSQVTSGNALSKLVVGPVDATGSYSASCSVLVGIALLGGFAVLGLPERERAL